MTAGTSGTAIALEGVVRTFGEVHALDGVSLEIGRGEVVGLLGHNGAGKTTTVRLVAGLLAPTVGHVRVAGLDPLAEGVRVRRMLGVLPSNAPVDDRLTARQNLRFAADLFGLSRDGLADRIGAALDSFELGERANERVEGFSSGMRQRLALARVLLPDPQVLLLDEPSAALDPLAVRQVRRLIWNLSREKAHTVVLCTHDLAEAQQLCDRVVVLDHGRVVTLGSPAELARGLSTGDVEIEIDPDDVETARSIAAGAAGPVELAGRDTLRCANVGRDAVPDLLRQLVSSGVRVYGLRSVEPSLEDVYVSLYADRERV
ncbi:MAG: ABC transporter ATP-binding protein [Streptosporangiaceae bacterium]